MKDKKSQSSPMNREDAVNQLKKMYKILSEDLDEIVSYGKGNNNSFAHRTLVRTSFALIEGVSYQLRLVTLASLGQYEGRLTPDEGRLTPGEICILKEEKYTLDKKGNPEAKECFQNTLPTLLFSMICYVKNHGGTFVPDTGNHGWDSMKKLVGIRNNLMHPKSIADLTLSDEQLEHVRTALIWWEENLRALFKTCDKADTHWNSKLNTQ